MKKEEILKMLGKEYKVVFESKKRAMGLYYVYFHSDTIKSGEVIFCKDWLRGFTLIPNPSFEKEVSAIEDILRSSRF